MCVLGFVRRSVVCMYVCIYVCMCMCLYLLDFPIYVHVLSFIFMCNTLSELVSLYVCRVYLFLMFKCILLLRVTTHLSHMRKKGPFLCAYDHIRICDRFFNA